MSFLSGSRTSPRGSACTRFGRSEDELREHPDKRQPSDREENGEQDEDPRTVRSRIWLLRFAEFLKLFVGERVVQVCPPELCDYVVGSLSSRVRITALLKEFVEGTVDRASRWRVVVFSVQVHDDGRWGKGDISVVKQVQNWLTGFIHPCEPPAHRRNPFSCHKAPPNGGEADTYTSSTETYTSEVLSTPDIKEGLPAQSGGLGVQKRRRTCYDTSDTTQGRPAMQANDLRGLESPATAVNRDLSHADALPRTKVRGAGARVTASSSSQTTLGEGHLRPEPDQ